MCVCVCMRVCWRGGIMSQLPLCCKTTKDKQKRHITSSPSHVKHEEHGSGSGVLIFYYFQFFMISNIFVWVASSASYHAGPINGNLLFSSLTSALKLMRACTLCNFPALLPTRRRSFDFNLRRAMNEMWAGK